MIRVKNLSGLEENQRGGKKVGGLDKMAMPAQDSPLTQNSPTQEGGLAVQGVSEAGDRGWWWWWGNLLIVTVTLVSYHLDYLFGAALERSTRSYIYSTMQ